MAVETSNGKHTHRGKYKPYYLSLQIEYNYTHTHTKTKTTTTMWAKSEMFRFVYILS